VKHSNGKISSDQTVYVPRHAKPDDVKIGRPVDGQDDWVWE
jgi:hypothetical protein